MAAPLRELFGIFLKIGNITFGGGDPTMAALQRELQGRRGWLTAEAHSLAYALARITPGTNMLAYGAGIGYQLGGWAAAVLGVVAMTVPSAVLVVWLTAGYEAFKMHPLIQGAVSGIIAAAVGMMIAASLLLAKPAWLGGDRARALVFVAASFAMVWLGKVNPVVALVVAGAGGFLWRPAK